MSRDCTRLDQVSDSFIPTRTCAGLPPKSRFRKARANPQLSFFFSKQSLPDAWKPLPANKKRPESPLAGNFGLGTSISPPLTGFCLPVCHICLAEHPPIQSLCSCCLKLRLYLAPWPQYISGSVLHYHGTFLRTPPATCVGLQRYVMSGYCQYRGGYSRPFMERLSRTCRIYFTDFSMVLFGSRDTKTIRQVLDFTIVPSSAEAFTPTIKGRYRLSQHPHPSVLSPPHHFSCCFAPRPSNLLPRW